MTASSHSTSHHQKQNDFVTRRGSSTRSYCTMLGLFHLFLFAALLIDTTFAAPLSEDETEKSPQAQIAEYYGNSQDAMSCYYNFQHYEEGDRIITNEPCLNCTCHRRMLMCYLRVCPFTKAVGQNCTVEKRPDQCCPVFNCPEVPVQLLTSSTTPTAPPTESSQTSEIAHPDTFGCMIENAFYPDGAQVPSDPKNPCELCYCIRNRTACVLQECTLNVEGCKPVHQLGVCCPVRYDCDYEEIPSSSEANTATGLLLTTTQSPQQCNYHGQPYSDGELISLMQSEGKSCERCYCMRGEIVCAVQDCGNPLEGKDCEPIPPPSGQCCPTTYLCANETVPIDSLLAPVSTVKPPTDLSETEVVNEDDSSVPIEQPALTPPPFVTSDEQDEVTPIKVEEQDTADSKQSGMQVVPEPEITKVTSVAETHTEISISTKQDEQTEKPKIADDENKTEKEEESSSQIDETAAQTTMQPEKIDEKIAENVEKQVDATTIKTSVEESSSMTQIPLFKPHPIEIDEPETPTSEEHTTVVHDKLSDSMLEETDEQEHHDSEHTTEPVTSHINDITPDSETTEKPQLEQSTISEKISQPDASDSGISSTEAALDVTTSSNVENSETEKISQTQAPEDKPENEPLPTSSEAVTQQPQESIGETSSSAETETSDASQSNDDKTSEVHEDESANTEKPTEGTVLANENMKPVESDGVKNEEGNQNLMMPQTGIEQDPPEHHDDMDEIDEELAESNAEGGSHPVEIPKPVETEETKPVEDVRTTVSPSKEDDLDKTTVSTDLKIDEHSQSTNEESTTLADRAGSQGGDDQTISYSELSHTETQSSTMKEQLALTTESVINNEISIEVDQPTSVPHHDDEVPALVAEEHTSAIEKGVIPGEGSCLADGTTYADGATIPATNPCHTECQCRASIIQCVTVECAPAPPHMKNCMPVQHSDDICCPIYTCSDDKEHITLKPDSMLGIQETDKKHDEEIQILEDVTTVSLNVDSVTTTPTKASESPAESEKEEPEAGSPLEEPIATTVSSKIPVDSQPVEVEHDLDKNKDNEESNSKPNTVFDNLPEGVEHDALPEHHDSATIPEEHISQELPQEHSDTTEKLISEGSTDRPESSETEEHILINTKDEITTSSSKVESSEEIGSTEISHNDSTESSPEEHSEHQPLEEHSEHQPIEEHSEHQPIEEHSEHQPLEEHSEHQPIEEHSEHQPLEEHSEHQPIEEHSEHQPIEEHSEHQPIEEHSEHQPIEEHSEHQPLEEHTEHQPMEEHITTEDHHLAESSSDLPHVDHDESSPDVPQVDNNEGLNPENVPEQPVEESVPVSPEETTLSDLGSTSPQSVPSKFEEFDIPEPTPEIPSSEAQEAETTSPDIKKPEDTSDEVKPEDTSNEVTTEDQTSVTSEIIHQVPSESITMRGSEEGKLVPTTTVPAIQEEQHSEATQTNSNEELDSSNNILTSAISSSIPDKVEQDGVPENDNVPNETEPSPLPEIVSSESVTEVSHVDHPTTVRQEIVSDGVSENVIAENTESPAVEETPETSGEVDQKPEAETEKINVPTSSEKIEPTTEQSSAHDVTEAPSKHQEIPEDITTEPTVSHLPIETTEVVKEQTTIVVDKQELQHTPSESQPTVSEEAEPASEEIMSPTPTASVHTVDELTTHQADNLEEKPEIAEESDDKKQVTDVEAEKPVESVESETIPQSMNEGEKKPEESQVFTTSSSSESPLELTTKFTSHISTPPPQVPESNELPANIYSQMATQGWTQKPFTTEEPHNSEEEPQQQHFQPTDTGSLSYEDIDDENPYGPGTCRYGGKVFVSAQQVPRDNPCDFCFCFRSDIICLQQSCPPPIHGCRQESIQGFCCPRYECPVSMATTLNLTTTTTTTTTTLPPHFLAHAYRGAARQQGCQVQGSSYRVGEEILTASGPCLHCICGADGQLKCDPQICSPEPLIKKMIEEATHQRR